MSEVGRWTFRLPSASLSLMRILMISAEAPPLQHPGALIELMESLPSELRGRGHEVSVVMPFYQEVRLNPGFTAEATGITVDVVLGEKSYVAEFLEGRSAGGVQ